MNLLDLLTRDEPVAGLEISDTHVRIVQLSPQKKGLVISFIMERALEEGIVAGGRVKDRARLAAVLRELFKNTKHKIRSVILSIPADDVYFRVFGFPRSIQGKRLEETMKLTVGFQLPVKPELAYLDWEKVEGSEQNEIFLAEVERSIADEFVVALGSVGVMPIAVEFHPLSIARAGELPRSETTLLTLAGRESTGVFVFQKGTLRFGRVLPKTKVPDAALAQELRKISDFYEAEHGSAPKALSLSQVPLREDFARYSKLKQYSQSWLVALGAALRGIVPRAQDSLISLMPVGTEEAYERQRVTAFTELLSNLTVGIAAVFVVAFGATFALLVSLNQQKSVQIQNLNSVPLPQDTAEIEARAARVNDLVTTASAIVHTTPQWSMVLEELRARTVSGITVTDVSFAGVEELTTVMGIAQNRVQLNAFRRALEESLLFGEVELPLAHLEVKERIPFSISFRIKDPETVYLP